MCMCCHARARIYSAVLWRVYIEKRAEKGAFGEAVKTNGAKRHASQARPKSERVGMITAQ